MSEKPHTVALGAFIVGALLIAIGAVIFVLGSGFGKQEKIIMVFDGSVKGLNVGAPVALRGVQVGEVTDIEVILDADTLELIMLVEANFRNESIRRRGHTSGDLTEELIQRGLRAQLNTQSLLTGLLYIQFDFHPDSPLNLADVDSPHVQIPTIPTNLERIARKLEDMDFGKFTNDLESAAAGISSFVSSEAFQTLPANIQTTLNSLAALSDQVQAQLANSIPKVDKVLDGAAITVASANTELPGLAEQVRGNLEVLNQAVASFEQTVTHIDGLVAPDSATTYRLNQALRELALAGRALQLLAKTLDEQPESLIRGRSGDEQ